GNALFHPALRLYGGIPRLLYQSLVNLDRFGVVLAGHGDLSPTGFAFIGEVGFRGFFSLVSILLLRLTVVFFPEIALRLIELIPPRRLHLIGIFHFRRRRAKSAATGESGGE